MEARTKLGAGAVLAVFGGLGMVIIPALGLADLQRPWGFVLGFLVGLVCGLGTALAVAGLVETRRGGH